MYKLFLETKGGTDLIKICDSVDDVNKMINHWLNLHNYHAHYFRQWKMGSRTYIDFGSWTQFFYYVEDNND